MMRSPSADKVLHETLRHSVASTDQPADMHRAGHRMTAAFCTPWTARRMEQSGTAQRPQNPRMPGLNRESAAQNSENRGFGSFAWATGPPGSVAARPQPPSA